MVKNKEGLRDLEICRSVNMMQVEQFRSTVLWVGYVVGEIYLIRMNVTQKNDPENLLWICVLNRKFTQLITCSSIKRVFSIEYMNCHLIENMSQRVVQYLLKSRK